MVLSVCFRPSRPRRISSALRRHSFINSFRARSATGCRVILSELLSFWAIGLQPPTSAFYECYDHSSKRRPALWFSPLLFTLPFLDFFRLLWLLQIALSVSPFLCNDLPLCEGPFQSHFHEI